jgi:hypothetical protein
MSSTVVIIAVVVVIVIVGAYYYNNSKQSPVVSDPASSPSQSPYSTAAPLIQVATLAPYTQVPTAAPFVQATVAPYTQVPTAAPFVQATLAPYTQVPTAAPFVQATMAPFVPITPTATPLITIAPTPAAAFIQQTLAPTTSVTIAVTPSPVTSTEDPIEGNWDSYVWSGNQLGPVTISFIGTKDGTNSYYIDGDKLTSGNYSDDMRYLAIDTNTLSATLTGRTDLLSGKGNVMMVGKKAAKIGTTDSYVNLSRPVTAPVDPSDPIAGAWTSYTMAGNQLGPVTIVSTGGQNGVNTYLIQGDKLNQFGDGYKMLAVNPAKMTATLTGRTDLLQDAQITVLGQKPRAIKIGTSANYVNLTRPSR